MRYKGAYVLPRHVMLRVNEVLAQVALREGVGEGDLEWAYHLSFVWSDVHVPGGSVLGHWVRTLCGPAMFDEPAWAWVTSC